MNKMTTYPLSEIKPNRWILIITIFCLVIGVHFWVDSQLGFSALGGDEYLESIFALKQMNPSLYPLDPHYSNAANFEMYTPFFLAILKTGFKNIGLISTFAIMQPLLGFTYLVCMFILLYKLTGKFWLSLSMALISAPVVSTYPTENWGGALSRKYAIPRTFFLAALPIIFYLWIRFQEAPKKLPLVYLLIGLLTYMHPPTGAVLTAALLLAQIYLGQFSVKSITQAAVCGFSALIPVIPFAMHYFGSTQEGYRIPVEQFGLYLKAAFYRILFIDPHFIISYLPTALLEDAGWLGLGTWAFIKLKKSLNPVYGMFVLSCLTIFIGYFAVTYLVLVPMHILPTLIDFTRVTKFIFLPVFIVVVLWLAQFQGRELTKRIIAVFVLGSFLSFDSMVADVQRGKPGRIFEHQFKGYAENSDFIITKTKFRNRDNMNLQAEMALWVKEHLPNDKALIHVGELSRSTTNVVFMRVMSQRSFLPSRKDGGLFYYTNKPLYLKWYLNSLKLNAIRQKYGYCSVAEQDFARSQGANYLICAKSDKPDKQAAIAGLKLVHENSMLWLFSLEK
jgi:hypothetical protein